LSTFLCKWRGPGLEVGADAVGVDEGEFAEGGFPALGEGAFDEFAGGVAGLAFGSAGFLGAFAGSFVFDVADGEPEQFDRGGVVGEVAAVLDDFAELVVQRLDAYLEPLAGLVP
jgi:hypothetical protein